MRLQARVMPGCYGHDELQESVGWSHCHHQPGPSPTRQRERQIFITVSFYLCCKLWEDNNGVNVVKILIRSAPIISIIGDSISRSGVDRERTNVMCHHLISCYSEVWRCVRPLYLCCDGSQGVMCRPRVTWHSWHVMPRCHSANICPGVTQHCHNGSLKPGG